MEISEVQRSRMLNAAVAVVAEGGYAGLSVARITGRARVSRRTFYDVFTDREDCFLAVCEDAVGRVGERVARAYAAQPGGWVERVRAGLTAFLAFLEEEPQIGTLLVVDALGAGPQVLGRRAEVLAAIGATLDRDGARRPLPQLTGEGVVGAVCSVIHTRLLAGRSASLLELVNPLMATIALPYRGAAAAQRELERQTPAAWPATLAAGEPSAGAALARDPLAGLEMRLTYRTLRVLAAIGEHPGESNRRVGDAAGVTDPGQMSKLLARLERLGLVQNAGPGHPHGEPNSWRLTALGESLCGEIEASRHASRERTNGVVDR